MVNRSVAPTHEDLTQTYKERLFSIEVKAFFCGDQPRTDIERRLKVKSTASASEISTYSHLTRQNIFCDTVQGKYMSNGFLNINVQAPLVGYALRRWSVDCSADHTLDPKEHYLWLSNPQTLYGVESADLAPGFKRTKG